MAQLEFIPTLSSCIETTAEREYWQAVGEYLRTGEKELEGKIELLRLFLEKADFRELRRQSEKYLIEGKNVSFILYMQQGGPRYEMKVD
jgi:hypothetical protein